MPDINGQPTNQPTYFQKLLPQAPQSGKVLPGNQGRLADIMKGGKLTSALPSSPTAIPFPKLSS
jgi:hypothetical protein